ncbi:MAG: NFYB/HAP3 family transcription factor subunit [Candidatus Aenigmatarchaeota archaeon]
MLSLLSFEKLSKKVGVKRISKEAIEELRDEIEEFGLELAEKAVRISRHAGRRTVMAQDVKFIFKTEEK